MSGITLKLSGLDEVLKKLDVKKLEREITGELIYFGTQVSLDAKNNVENNGTTDRGDLAGSIDFKSDHPLSVSIFANKDYAAYIEFGTRKFAASYVATLPPDWQTFAAQYKGGGGGSFQEFLMRITEWVKRKGFAAAVTKSGNKSKSVNSVNGEKEAAYRIALSILRNGIKAQPFLFPAFEKNRPELIKNLKTLLK